MLGNRKTKAGTFSNAFRSHPGLVKLIEDSILLLGRDAYARVAHRQLECLVIGLGFDPYPSAGRRELHCITQQIEENLFESNTISLNTIRQKSEWGKSTPLPDRLRLNGPEYFGERLRPIEALEFQLRDAPIRSC